MDAITFRSEATKIVEPREDRWNAENLGVPIYR